MLIGIRAGIPLACSLLLGAGFAQEPTPPNVPAEPQPAGEALRHVELTTGDGSRFLLVPTGGPPVVHWVMATPGGALEDPPGFDGLAFAVARAAMRGTSLGSAEDSVVERDALAALDILEQEHDRQRAAGETPDADALTALDAARVRAAGLTNPLAWEKALRSAPALGAELSQVTEGTLLHITTSYSGLPRAAQLLLERREGRVLRGVHHEFRLVREEMARQRSVMPRDAMRREVLGLSFLGHPYARAYSIPNEPRPLSRLKALQVFRRTQHPLRTFHVLTGGFDIDKVTATLDKVFARTGLGEVERPLPPQRPQSSAERRSSMVSTTAEAVTIGFRLPTRPAPNTLGVLVDWLTGGPEARLAKALRQRGHPRATVRGTAPFPGRAHGLLLVEVEDAPDGIGVAAGGLVKALEEALEDAAQNGPTAAEIERSLARVSARTAASKLGARNLAFELALACGLEGRSPTDVLGESPAPTPAELRELGKLLLAPANRALVALEVAQ